MKALSDTANGSLAGKNKIMLETYIQTTYFDRILERANIRLSKMSGGQYDLKRRTEASNQGKTGLELDIIDHINTTERSVNTLSGGEAFLASLALALGLSDEVQMPDIFADSAKDIFGREVVKEEGKWKFASRNFSGFSF